MLRLVTSTAAPVLMSFAALSVASLPAFAQTPLLASAPIAYNWSGFYVGGFGGDAWTDITATELFTESFGGVYYLFTDVPYGLSAGGFTGGGQAGYDWQWRDFVFGVAGEFGYMDLQDLVIDPSSRPVPAPEVQVHTRFKADWFGSLTGRVGIPFYRLLIYAKGGVAFLSAEAATIDTCGRSFCGQTKINAFGDGMLLGWTLGGGAEAALTEHLRVGAEYRFYDFESFEVSGVATNLLEYSQGIEVEGIHTARVFVNYVW